MKRFSVTLFALAVATSPLLVLCTGGNAQVASTNNKGSAATALPRTSASGVLFRSDFSQSGWTGIGASTVPTSMPTTASVKPVGTVDVVGGTEASAGLLLTAKPPGSGPWSARLVSGLLPITNTETNLGKLTLSFSLSASTAKPVAVRVESFDAGKKRTGTLVGTVYPAAPDFFQRYALDLSTLKQEGAGKFDPKSPFVQISFEGSDDASSAGSEYQLRLDNINYATPTFYVNPKGSDTNNGRTEKTAFATVQKAIDAAQPGDIIVLMKGTYNGGNAPVVSFRRGGLPDAWIVLKNYPGQKPTLTSTGWNIVSIADGSKEMPSETTSLCYLEVRGLHVRGEGDVAKKKYPEAMNKGDSRTNSNGIAVDGRYMKNYPHHIRLADNLVEYCPGQGLGALEADWVTIEDNISRFNSWTTIYATSGISVMGASNFDAQDNVYKILVRNNICYRNETFEIWEAIKKPSDGNGIILDVNQKTESRPDSVYLGRTLVQSNLCFDNGGSGIHTVTANRVDIINNTAYLNSASKNLQYSQIYTYGSEDVRIINNILVAPVADVAAGEKPEPVNRISGPNKNVVFLHNIYSGGNIPPALGEGDVIADPQFVKPTRDPKVADFHLKAGSPAIGKGIKLPFSPFHDIDGKPRTNPPTKGVYEK